MEALFERLTECWSGLNRSRDQLAEVLCEIRAELANDRKFSWELRERGIPRRTAYDLMEDWKWVEKLKPAQLVRHMAARMSVDLTAERYQASLTKHKSEVQEATTEEEAVEVLDKVKRESKRKRVILSESEQQQKDRDELLGIGNHLLAGMTSEQKIRELQHLLEKLLPGEIHIDIKLPTQKMKVVSIGA
jgi:hypothetical protein